MFRICGILGKSDVETIEKMLGAMIHKGFDGRWLYDDVDISFGVCGLGIAGTEKEVQPVFNEKHTACVLFNGEIYNYLDLKRRLIRKGHDLSTEMDAEIVLHLFEEYGEECVTLLKGTFAFAIWDGKKLFLARDRMGVKPLFYTFLSSEDLFIFGSEIKAIFQHEQVPRSISERALCEQSIFGFILSPELTLFEGIRQLHPGTTMTVHRNHCNGKIKYHTEQYYQLDAPAPADEYISYQDIEEKTALLQSKLEESCNSFVSRSTLPKGIMLSGGLDSTLLALCCSRYSSVPIHTFSIADSLGHPDIEFARKVSEHIGSEHHEFIVDFDEFIGQLPQMVFALEGLVVEGVFPHGGEGAFFLLSKHASRFVKVALCGEGADELFGGYWMHEYPLGYYDQLQDRINSLNSSNPYIQDLRIKIMKWFPAQTEEELSLSSLDFFFRSSLANYHLWAVDRGSMWHGLEVGVPYLYDDVVQMAVRIPYNLKMNRGVSKYILRKVANRCFNYGQLMDIISREKRALPSAFTNMLQRLTSLCDETITDEYVRRHPFKEYLRTKVDMLMFDLLYYTFIEGRGKIPASFIFDLHEIQSNSYQDLGGIV